MIYPTFFESKSSQNLFGLENYFNFISKLYLKQNGRFEMSFTFMITHNLLLRQLLGRGMFHI